MHLTQLVLKKSNHSLIFLGFTSEDKTSLARTTKQGKCVSLKINEASHHVILATVIMLRAHCTMKFPSRLCHRVHVSPSQAAELGIPALTWGYILQGAVQKETRNKDNSGNLHFLVASCCLLLYKASSFVQKWWGWDSDSTYIMQVPISICRQAQACGYGWNWGSLAVSLGVCLPIAVSCVGEVTQSSQTMVSKSWW